MKKQYKVLVAALAFGVCLGFGGMSAEAATAAELVSAGQTALVNKDYSRAESAFSEAIAQDAALAEAYDGRARALKRQGKLDECLADLSKAIGLAPGKALYPYHRGSVYLEYKHYPEAVADLSKAAELEPKAIEPYLNIVKAYDEAGQTAEAVRSGDRLIEMLEQQSYVKLESDTVLDKETMAVVYASVASVHQRQLPEDDKALPLCNKAVALDPDGFAGYYIRASVNLALNKLTEAEADCRRSLELCKPQDNGMETVARFLLSSVKNKQGDNQTALAEINKVLDKIPNAADAFLCRAQIFSDLGENEKARADLRTYLELGGSREKIGGKLKELLEG